MTTQEIKNHLKQMVGQDYVFDKTRYIVIETFVEEAEDIFSIVTDKHTFRKSFSAADKYFPNWKLYQEPGEEIKENPGVILHQNGHPSGTSTNLVVSGVQKDTTTMDELVKILKDSIEKVQVDPTYIPQATSIKDNVQTIIDVHKQKIEFYKMFKNNK